MSESKDKDKDREKDKIKDKEKDKTKEIDRGKCSSSTSFTTITAIASRLSSPTTDNANNNNNNSNNNSSNKNASKGDKFRKNQALAISDEFLLKPPMTSQYKTSLSSIESEVFAFDLESGILEKLRQSSKDETSATVGTQRVYKKTSPNSILTMYLPTREIISCGTQPSILKGILFVDPKAIQGYRVYAQLTLTFRYGREDEEVMGLRFCNEAIMSLYQIYPRTEDPKRDSLTPLQDALIKRLGIGAFPFTLSLSPQSPPSVQLVPAKRYYGAPIGTSYDVRCFIADKTDDKFHRKATVKMGVRVIHKTDILSSQTSSDNFTAALLNNPLSPPPPTSPTVPKNKATSTNICINTINSTPTTDIPPDQADKSTNNPTTLGATTTTLQKSNIIGVRSDMRHQIPLTNPNDSNSNINRLHTLEKGNNLTGGCFGIGDNLQKTNLQQLQPFIQSSQPPIQQQPLTTKSKKQERVDSFPKIRLSPKSFRFSGRFGRSKSEVERGSTDPFYNYSKSFHEVSDFSMPESCGPQGAVDKPFLLQEGRVCLRASLNKSWYTHAENVIVTVNIRNESKKTVRKIRVCAIQHVDVCMFNNGKFKNVVADSDNNNLPSDQTTVGPGKTLCSKIILTPKRGPTKNWIALEDSLQRCSEPDEITGDIAASAVRIPTINPIGSSPSAVEDRNVFAIYVSYYVKVKLTLSGMGGELSLKLPFSLVHIDSSKSDSYKTTITNETNKLKQIEKPISIIKANSTGTTSNSTGQTLKDKTSVFSRQAKGHASDDDIIDIEEDYDIIRTDNSKSCEHHYNINDGSYGSGGNNSNKNLRSLERIDSIEDEIPIQIPNKNLAKRRLTRSDIRVKDSSQDDNDEDLNTKTQTTIIDALVHRTMKISSDDIEIHTIETTEQSKYSDEHHHHTTTEIIKENTLKNNIKDNGNSNNDLTNKCDIKKTIQQEEHDNNVPMKNGKSVSDDNNLTSSTLMVAIEPTIIITSHTNDKSNDNTDNNSNQKHHVQTICAQIHTPHNDS